MTTGQLVRHLRWGLGTVEIDKGDVIVVRFEQKYESCLRADLETIEGPLDAVANAAWHSPIELVARAQAAAISSVNDAWGVFSMSQIALLPHQLWVCHRVLRNLPARWLIADDVGLGKTIEAGLILRAMIHRGLAERILIVCPASLTGQWQERLGDMFDIRAGIYSRDSDTGRYSFFDTNRHVIASLQTLRLDRERPDGGNWMDRLLGAPPWDVVMVDEAHHLNSTEKELTLGYKLIQRLLEADRVGSTAKEAEPHHYHSHKVKPVEPHAARYGLDCGGNHAREIRPSIPKCQLIFLELRMANDVMADSWLDSQIETRNPQFFKARSGCASNCSWWRPACW